MILLAGEPPDSLGPPRVLVRCEVSDTPEYDFCPLSRRFRARFEPHQIPDCDCVFLAEQRFLVFWPPPEQMARQHELDQYVVEVGAVFSGLADQVFDLGENLVF